MRKRIRRAMMLLAALPVLGFLGLWFFAPNAELAEQKRLEEVVLGNTWDQANTALIPSGWRSIVYQTRDQCQKLHGVCRWSVGQEAIGHWQKGEGNIGSKDTVSVVFDGNGTATTVMYQSSFSLTRKRWGLP